MCSQFVGAPGFEPGVTCSQSKHVSRYTTPRYWTSISHMFSFCQFLIKKRQGQSKSGKTLTLQLRRFVFVTREPEWYKLIHIPRNLRLSSLIPKSAQYLSATCFIFLIFSLVRLISGLSQSVPSPSLIILMFGLNKSSPFTISIFDGILRVLTSTT